MTKKGIIVKAISGFYYVDLGDKAVQCRARGNMRKSGSPLVGDSCEISLTGDSGVIEQISPRKNYFCRPPVSNIDKLFIVSSFQNPAPNTLIIDKLICMCEKMNIEPIIVFNKSDMGDFSHYVSIYEKAGFTAFVISCQTGEGLCDLKNSIKGICAFTGNSGVGKSSILNYLFPGLNLETGDVSQKLGRGRHTTREVRLFKTEIGYVVDTPGFSTIDLGDMKREEVFALFREMESSAGMCKFTSCSHTKELGCDIIRRVNEGEIAKERFESYCAIYNEVSLTDRQYKK